MDRPSRGRSRRCARLFILVLIFRSTTWGRAVLAHHRRLLHRSAQRAQRLRFGWALLLLSVITGVRLDVLFSFQGNDMMTSFQVIAGLVIANGNEAMKVSGARTASTSRCSFSCIMAEFLHVARIMLDLFIVQRFMLAWRAWLNDRVAGDWLDGGLLPRPVHHAAIDNPDQRIQDDIDIFPRAMARCPTPRT